MDSLPAELPRKPIKLPYDPEITLLGIRPEKTIIQKDTCTQKFLEPLSTISMTWKKYRCLSMNGERYCGTCMYTMECSSVIKGNEFVSFLVNWMKLEPVIQREINQKEKNKYPTSTHICEI